MAWEGDVLDGALISQNPRGVGRKEMIGMWIGLFCSYLVLTSRGTDRETVDRNSRQEQGEFLEYEGERRQVDTCIQLPKNKIMCDTQQSGFAGGHPPNY